MVTDIINELYDKEYQLTVQYMNNKTVENWNELIEFRRHSIQIEEAIMETNIIDKQFGFDEIVYYI
jgi:hypothetical protein